MSPRRRHDRRKRQEAALKAWIEEGTAKAAAHRLGLSEAHVRRLVAGYCEAHGYISPVQAAAYYVQDPDDEARIAHS